MRIYVSGGITHVPDFRERFAATTARLRAHGHTVVSPVEEYSGNGTPVPVGSPEYDAIMSSCLNDVALCDGLCQLTGWQSSNGAVKEAELAERLGLVIGNEDDFLSMQFLKWTGDEECAPKRHYEGDAGYDLFVSEEVYIPRDTFRDVPLGISVELPEGTWALLTGRSSTIRRRGLLIVNGIIDNGYRGELYAACQNLGDVNVTLERGERVAQLILFPLITPEPLQVAELSESERDVSAFGSTGR